MVDLVHYTSFPIGSLLNRPEQDVDRYFQELPTLPPNLAGIAVSPRTASYLRGTIKAHDLPSNHIPTLAFLVLQVIFGELSTTQLAGSLSNQLQLSPEKAQAIAQDIEKELFAPVALELNTLLQKKKNAPPPATPSSPPHESGARNVLDLKTQRPAPPPPPIPRGTSNQ